MAARTFTVETRGQAVAIFGGKNGLIADLLKEYKALGIHAQQIATVKALEDLRIDHDPDYLVVFDGGVTAELELTLKSLIESGESRLIKIENFASGSITPPLGPVSKHLIVSDYVGESELSSRVIEPWLNNIKTNRKLNVPGDGLTEWSLLGQSDLAHLIARASLWPSTAMGERYYLGNPEGISLLNLAYLIRTNCPYKVDLSFSKVDSALLWDFDSAKLTNLLNQLDYVLVDDPESILRVYLKSFFAKNPVSAPEIPVAAKIEIPVPPTPKPVEPPVQKSVSPIKKLTPLKSFQPTFVPLQTRKPKFSLDFRWHKSAWAKGDALSLSTIIGRGLLIAIALYLATLAFCATITVLSLKNMFASLATDQLPPNNKLSSFASSYLQANVIAFSSIPLVARNQSIIDLNLVLDSYNQALSAFNSAHLLEKSAAKIADYVFGNGSIDAAQTISQGRLQAEELYQKLSLLDGTLPMDMPPTFPAKYKDTYQGAKSTLTKLKREATVTKAVLAVTPDFIGLGARRKYGVLFQNNTELRATGGFIGSFAVLTFENGKLYDMPIFDVYDADGQLKGHVDPPKPIKDILGEANWYLRDSNFDPDFPTTARRAEWFIKKSLNQDLDGTIALDIGTLSELLKATGPLDIPDYNEQVTSDNVLERTELHAEGNFFPGSTKKKEFLSTVGNTLFTHLSKLSAGEGLKLLEALSTSVQRKSTLISVLSPSSDRVFATLGWNGQLNDFPCPTATNCNKDYVMVVDSNFGVNKANYFIKRDIQVKITFDKNLAVNHALRVSYQNTASSTAWPSGIYKNYQRLYLPIGTTISSVKIGDKQLDPKDYVISSEHNKMILSYLVSVPISSSVVVEVSYTSPQLSSGNDLLYTWYWQKQPGTSPTDNISIYLNYPLSLTPQIISPQAEIIPQQLKFNLINDTDHRITVKFSK